MSAGLLSGLLLLSAGATLLLSRADDYAADDDGSVLCGEKLCGAGQTGCCDDGYDLHCMGGEDACLDAHAGMWFEGGRLFPDAATMKCGDKSCADEKGSTGCCDRGRGYRCAQSKKRCVARNGLWREGPVEPTTGNTCGQSVCPPGRSYVGCCDRGGGWLCEPSKYDCVHKDGIFAPGDNPYPKFLEVDEVVNETFWVPTVTCGSLLCDFIHMGCCKVRRGGVKRCEAKRSEAEQGVPPPPVNERGAVQRPCMAGTLRVYVVGGGRSTFDMARATYPPTHAELPLRHGVFGGCVLNLLPDVCVMCVSYVFAPSILRALVHVSPPLSPPLSPRFPPLPRSFPLAPFSLQNTVEHGFSCTTSKKICVDSGGEWADGLTEGHGQATAKDRGAFSTATHALVVKWNILHQVFHTYIPPISGVEHPCKHLLHTQFSTQYSTLHVYEHTRYTHNAPPIYILESSTTT